MTEKQSETQPPSKDEKKQKSTGADEEDIEILKKYGKGPYAEKIHTIEEDTKNLTKEINTLCGVRESETGLSLPQNWIIEGEKMAMNQESLMVGRITKIIDPNTDHSRYIVNIRHNAKYVVELNEQLSPTDVEEGMRVGVDKKNIKLVSLYHLK